MTIKEMKRLKMIEALQKCKTIKEAAKRLGITERKLYFFKKQENDRTNIHIHIK